MNDAPTIRLQEEEPAKSLPPTPPPRVWVVASGAFALSALAALAFGFGLFGVHGLVEDPSAWLNVLLVLLFLVSLLPLIPAASALTVVRRRRALLNVNKLVEARHAAAVGRGAAATAFGYAVSVLLVTALIWFATANDGAISETFLNFEFIRQGAVEITKAFWVNIRVSVGAEVLVLAFGLLIAIMRMLPGRPGRPLRVIAIIYVDVFRAIPSIIVLYLVGFGLSLAKVPVVEDFSPLWLAIIALTLTYTGYVGEVYRAGLESIHPSQWSAARSLGLSYGMTMRTVIIPQAVRRMIPPLLNDFIGLQKDTALIGVMGVIDAFMQSRLVASNVFNLSPVILVAGLFVLITIPQARFVDRLVSREQTRQNKGAQ